MDYINKYLDYLKYERKLSKNTILSYENDLNNYYKYIKNNILNVSHNDLENYIMLKLHEKIFPIHPTKGDEFINKKCERLNFIKAENIKGGKKKGK